MDSSILISFMTAESFLVYLYRVWENFVDFIQTQSCHDDILLPKKLYVKVKQYIYIQ